MEIIIIREDALRELEGNTIFPMINQLKVAEMIVNGKNIALYYVEIDADVENHLKSNGLNLNDIDQLSDFILSAAKQKN